MKMKNEYDFTKGMLNKLRSLNESRTSIKTLNEEMEMPNPEVSQEVKNDITVINDVDVKILSSDQADMKLSDEQENDISGLIDNFRQQVSQIVEFDPGLTINQRQIRLDGTLTDEDVSFVLIAGEESGVYINADMLKIEPEVMIVLDKLVKFGDTFKTSLEPMITQRDNNI
jgi:hypothetical protein